MKFSIITPSFNQPEWLKLCIRSVADQEGVEVEHIIQDGAIDPSIREWTDGLPGVSVYSEKDEGMYDAINRGLKRATGEIIAHLNCDEQYLPGTLAAVADYFREHPDVDIVFGDVIIVDDNCQYVCTRHVITPSYFHTYIVSLATFTAATFYRRSAVERADLYFDSSWRCIADGLWILKAMEARVKMNVLRRITSTFMDDGGNLALSPQSKDEGMRLISASPRWVRLLKPWWLAHHRLRRCMAGCYNPAAVTFEIFTPANDAKRSRFVIKHPTWRWDSRRNVA